MLIALSGADRTRPAAATALLLLTERFYIAGIRGQPGHPVPVEFGFAARGPLIMSKPARFG